MSSGTGANPSWGAAQRGSPRQGAQQRGGNRGRFKPTHRPETKPQPKKFTGKEEGLGDEYVYQYTDGSEATDQYTTTTEEIIRYASTKYKHGADVERSLADGMMLAITIPTAPATTGDGTTGTPTGAPETEMVVWKMRVQLTLQRMTLLEANLQSAYALIKGQCSKPILEKVEAQENYGGIHSQRDPMGLLGLIKGVMFNYNSRKDRAVTLIDIIKPSIVSQTRYMSASEYLEKFRTQLDVLKSAGGDICNHHGMITDELAKANAATPPTVAENEAARADARNRFEATLFLMRSNQVKYGRLVQELANDYNKGRDSYPKTLTEAYEMMLHDVRDQDLKPHKQGNPGMAFNTVGSDGPTGVPATNTQLNPRPDITCHKCGKNGHFSGKCREVTHATGTTLTVVTEGGDEATTGSSGESTNVTGLTGEDATMTTLGTIHEPVDGFQFMNNGMAIKPTVDGTVHSQIKSVVPTFWILLDNQSTVDVFSNKSLLRNVREAPNTCRISCNAGVVTTNMIGDLPGYPVPVWYHPDGIANILSLHRVSQHCRVTYDSDGDGTFQVMKNDGSAREFKPSASGLHYCDTRELHDETVLINTVEQNRNSYTVRAYKLAATARRLQDTIGRPSTRDFKKIVSAPWMRNCPVGRADVSAAENIFGANLGSLKGKTVRHKGDHVPSLVADVPYHIIKLHKDVTLCFDLMYVNKIVFLVTVSRNIRFGTTERLLSRNADVVGKALVNVTSFYRQRGFRVKECHGDGEFETLRATVADAHASLNITSESEHVPEIERYIRTLKERSRGAYNTVPFKTLPAVMIVEMVHASNFWLNMFPAGDGVSATQSPRQIMTGQQCDYKLHCKVQFGEYVQVHESHDNSMLTRTTGAIALRPTGNIQGGYFFMSLTTGKRINRLSWTPLPMPGEVIERVHVLARRNPAGRDIQFGWRDGTPIEDGPDDEDDFHDEDYMPDSNADSDSDDDDGSYAPEHPHPGAGVNDYDDGQAPYNSDGGDNDNGADGNGDETNEDNDASGDSASVADDGTADDGTDDGDANDGNDEDDSQSDDNSDDGGIPPPEGVATARVPQPEEVASDDGGMPSPEGVAPASDDGGMPSPEGVAPATTVVAPDPPPGGVATTGATQQTDETTTGVSAEMDEKYGTRLRGGLRARKKPRGSTKIKVPQSSAHHVLNIMLCEELYGMGGFSDLEHVALTQYNLKKGLQKYGKAAADAVTKEMKQLHDRKTIRPVHSRDLTIGQKRRALAYLMFIKEKRCGTVKGRGCADGRKQRLLHKSKDETSSPTVRTESLLLSCVIDAEERRQVMTADVPGAFMQVDVDEVVHVRMVGALAELLAKVDSKLYTTYLGTERGQPVLYVQLQKALYGTLTAAMLFWKDLSAHLSDEGFVANPYDCCVMNRTVGGKQQTVLWHVDDLKISHVDGAVNEQLLNKLNEWYGKETPLTVTRGDMHEYLGMTIDYSVEGKVKIRMDDYVENVVEEAPPDMDGKAATPAAEHLFKVDANAKKLDSDGSDLFHSMTAKLLFLCKRARPDIQTPIAFLCTRVSAPDVDDYKKLRRVICYLRGTNTMCLTLEANNLQVIKWWVDASFAVHWDMRSHTGATMSLGKGSVFSGSWRQKLNTRSSTTAELVGVDDAMPMVLWTRQFMEGQGYTIEDNILYQDNQSAMLLEMNGQKSSTKRTRHLDIRYFFVTDRIRAKKLTVEYCPTGDMWADVFTKPLQGAAFIKFRRLILNLD
jgi:hypothetical protein